MHYKNGRLVMVGDWVVGKTHNSQQKLLCGQVLETMPKQGPCNVRLLVFPSYLALLESDTEQPCIRLPAEGQPRIIGYKIDFADCAELFRVDDGWRMLHAVLEFGNHNAPCFPVEMG